MSAAKYDLFIEQGSVFSLKFVWKTGEPPAVVDLQTYTAALQARATVDATTTIFSLAVGTGITIGVDNSVTAALTSAQTAALSAEGKKVTVIDATTDTKRDWFKVGVYDLEVTSAGLETHRLLYGDVYVSPEVTR